MDYKIIWSDRSLINLKEIVEFVASDNVFAAEKLGQSLLQKVVPLAQFPQMGRVFSKLRRPDVREISAPPYRIIYQIVETQKVIIILTVWHGARLDPEIG